MKVVTASEFMQLVLEIVGAKEGEPIDLSKLRDGSALVRKAEGTST